MSFRISTHFQKKVAGQRQNCIDFVVFTRF